MTKRICVWSGKRGGFGALAPTMDAIRSHPDLELQVVVTDQHLYERFGRTVDEVESRFPISAEIDMEQSGDRGEDRARAIGVCLQRSAEVLGKLAPDVLVVIGDRGEVFAGCIAAHNMGIAIAHIQGGDISGSLDEPVRHAITKLAHIHFPSTEESADRIRRLGEDDWRIHVVGDTHIDQIILGDVTPSPVLAEKYDLVEAAPYVLVLQHSDSSAPGDAGRQMSETVEAILAIGRRALLVYPCSDQGYEGIIEVLESVRDRPRISVHRNIPAPDFIGLQRGATCLVGNSSAGLIEAPYFGLPAINVGDRQMGRERGANVIDVPYERKAIAEAIERVIQNLGLREALAAAPAPFGDGTAYRQITAVLADLAICPMVLNKRMTW